MLRRPGIRTASSPWKGQEGKKQESRKASPASRDVQLHCFTNNIKVMTRFCLSSGSPPRNSGRREGFEIDGLSEVLSFPFLWLTAPFPSLTLRCSTIRISNLIAYTNFIYVTWVHFTPQPWDEFRKTCRSRRHRQMVHVNLQLPPVPLQFPVVFGSDWVVWGGAGFIERVAQESWSSGKERRSIGILHFV